MRFHTQASCEHFLCDLIELFPQERDLRVGFLTRLDLQASEMFAGAITGDRPSSQMSYSRELTEVATTVRIL